MRVFAFFVYLCFQLLSGGNSVHAATNHSQICNALSQDLAKIEQVKLTTADHTSVLIELSDLVLEEDYLSGDDYLKDGSSGKFSVKKNNFLEKGYMAHSRQFILNYCSKHFNISQAFFGYSNPIYLTQRALRI
jgi:hypothetical protein